MDTLVVAIVGLTLALVSLFWQICSWVLEHATRLRIELSVSDIDMPNEGSVDGLYVTAINKGSDTVYVDEVSFGYRGSGSRFVLASYIYERNQLPGEVPARTRATSVYAPTVYAPTSCEGTNVDRSRPIRASVRLATGKIISSKFQVIDAWFPATKRKAAG